MITEYTKKVMAGNDLTTDEMITVLKLIMTGEVSDILISSFLTALSIKGEAISEITGGAKVMRDLASKVEYNKKTLDTCGTGGDHSNTYNISTAVAIVAAAKGISVAKHGNRSITSKSGSADVLEELGVNINLTNEQAEKCLAKSGIAFMFAPKYHSAMRYVMPVRKTLGFRTIFNLLGPLSNPANATYQILGVFDGKLTEIFAEVLRDLGVERALVVHGNDGLDEFSITETTKVSELKNGAITTYDVKPEDFGFARASIEDIQGGDKAVNAQIIRDIFNGQKGPKTDILLLNAGAALYVSGQVESISEGVEEVKEIIKKGEVSNKLEELIQVSNQLG